MADLDKLLGKYDAPRQPAAELKPYEFPWYDRLTNWATDMLYGDRATAQQRSGMNTVLGPDNPFNLPAQFTRGSGNVATGVRRGDPYQIAEGALEAGLSGLPIYAGARSAAGAFRGRPAPVPEGPWTMSPQEFGTWRDRNPTQFEPTPREPWRPKTIDESEAYISDLSKNAIRRIAGYDAPGVPTQGRVWSPEGFAQRTDHIYPAEMQALLDRFARNNEHIPSAAKGAEELNAKLGRALEDRTAIGQEQYRQYKTWDAALMNYADDFNGFHPKGHRMDPDELREILQRNYGVMPGASKDDIVKGYYRFMADEDAAQKARRPTWHDESYAAVEEGYKRLPEIEAKILELKRRMDPAAAKAPVSAYDSIPPFLGLVGGVAGAKHIADNVDTSDILRRILDQYGDHGYRP